MGYYDGRQFHGFGGAKRKLRVLGKKCVTQNYFKHILHTISLASEKPGGNSVVAKFPIKVYEVSGKMNWGFDELFIAFRVVRVVNVIWWNNVHEMKCTIHNSKSALVGFLRI